MGQRPGAYFTKEDILRCSELLSRAKLVAGDFATTLEHVKKGDFVYLDPPFAVNSRRIFHEYGKRVFTLTDMPRFAKSLDDIRRVGADFVVSYADCTESRALAREWNSVRLPIRRHVAGFSGARKNAYEWLITNLPLD
jgi:DNA adenine methylase